MNMKFHGTLRRCVGAAIATAALALTFSAIAQVPQSASAKQAGCQISAELQGSASREGISCGDSVDTPTGGIVPGTSSWACKFSPNVDDLPLGYFAFTSSSEHSFSHTIGTKTGHIDVTTYVKGDRVIGQITYFMNDDGTWRLGVQNMAVTGYNQYASFDCKSSKDGFQYHIEEENDTHISPDGTMYLAPGATPTTTASSSTTTDARVTALPGRPGEALVRVNVTNSSTSEGTAVDISFALDSYSIPDVLAVPGGTTCTVVEQTEHCLISSLEASSTGSIVLHTKAATSAAVGSPFDFSVGSNAMINMKTYAGDPSGLHENFWTNEFALDMPTS